MFRMMRAWLLAVGLMVASAGMAVGAGNVAASTPGSEPPTGESVADADIVEGEYVVILQPAGGSDSSLPLQAIDTLGVRIRHVMGRLAATSPGDVSAAATTDEVIAELGIVDGFGARLSPESAERLQSLPDVAAVYPNTVVTGDGLTENPTWGLDRIDQQSLPLDRSFTAPNDGSGVHVYVVDQAILPSHVEFARGLGDGVDLIGPPLEGQCYDHGTHVAGTAGGANVGVARAVTLHSVRILDCGGSGTVMGVLRGLDWVGRNAKRPAVVNMSLGGSGFEEMATTAVDRLAALGITTVVSAGNRTIDACDHNPASADRAITVAASDENDVAADFSNYGRCVDLYGPGVRVISASFKGPREYVAYDGTSMAVPHVTGMVAVYLHDHPNATPAQVHEAIVKGAVANKLKKVPAKTPNRLANLQALPDPGDGGPVLNEPVAYIRPVGDQVQLGAKTVFDGSGSIDPNGSPLTYAWTVDGSKEVVSTEPTFEYLGLQRGVREIRLTVANAKGQTDTTRLVIDVSVPGVLPPVAKAEPAEMYVPPGREFTIDASGSFSPYGGELSYYFQIRRASAPYELLFEAEGPKWTHAFPSEGKFSAEVYVFDEYGLFESAFVPIEVSSEPGRPIVVPGSNQVIPAGTSVTFDGSLSGSHLGGPAFENRTFSWWVDDPEKPESTKPTFTRRFDEVGSMWLMLTVAATENGVEVYRSDGATLVNVVPSEPPTMVLSPARGVTVEAGQPVVLNGVGTEDPDGGPMKLAWTVSGTSGVVSDDIVLVRIFDKPGTYQVTFEATDNEGETVTKATTVTVTKATEPPVVEFTPGEDQRIVVGQTVRFDGSASKDPDGGRLTFEWRSTGVSGVASPSSRYSRKFTAPGRYGVELKVIDDEGQRATKHVNVWVVKSEPPVVEFSPGEDQRIVVGQTVRFDGSASKDPDGGALTFEWRSTGVSGVASPSSRYSRKFTAPGRYGVELKVIDDEGDVARKHINVWVTKSEPPVVAFSPGEDQRIVVGQTLSFDGSASKDPDGGRLTFEWRSTGVSGVASPSSRYSRKFTAPGRYGVELTVIDDEGDVARKHINVWVTKS